MDVDWASQVLSTPIAVNVFCILLFSCSNFAGSSIDTGDILDCFSERFNSGVIRNITINGQEELDNFVDNVTSFVDDDTDRCIQLFLTRKAYELDMIKIMGVKLGTGGGLVMIGVANPLVTIDCVSTISGLQELRSNLKPLANVSLVVLSGLRFAGCPVPVVLEEVSTVIVQNCDFMYVSSWETIAIAILEFSIAFFCFLVITIYIASCFLFITVSWLSLFLSYQVTACFLFITVCWLSLFLGYHCFCQ